MIRLVFNKHLLSKEYFNSEYRLSCKKCCFKTTLSEFIVDIISSINTRQCLVNSKVWAFRNYLNLDRLTFDKVFSLKDGKLEPINNNDYKPLFFVINLILYDEQGRITC